MQAHLSEWLTDFNWWDASVLYSAFVFSQHGSWLPRLSDPRESEEESLVPVRTNLGSYILAFPLCLLEASH